MIRVPVSDDSLKWFGEHYGKRYLGMKPETKRKIVTEMAAAGHRHPKGELLTGGETGREYKCRWFVKTHWRSPWVKHPVTGERYQQPVLIHKYLAGPDDKPIKTPATTVWNVDR